MRAAIVLMMAALSAAAAEAAAPSVPAVIKLKNGTSYNLQNPPHLTGGRFVFTASDGQVYSLSEAEVDEVQLLSPAPDASAGLNPQDSHALGAIARQERGRKGQHTLIAPAATPKPKPKKTHTP